MKAKTLRRAVVIGGGLGGLATAVRLAAGGWRVEVCEQGPRFGGKMNCWERGGFRFDTGPSLITMPWVFEELFAAAGESLAEHVTLAPVSPLADYVFADGTRFTYTTSLPEWLATVRQIEPRDCEGFMRFTRLGASIYGLSQETFLRREPLAPEGGETLFVMANAPAAGGAWDERRIEAARARVFERLSRGGFPDVLPDAAVSDVWTPGHIEREYLSPGGAIYGTHSHGWRRAFLRPPNRHPRVGGLYHVGGSSHPGGGTPTVLLSARITSGLIGRHEA